MFEYTDLERKLLILYLLNSMELPMSRTLITEFVIKKELLSHFALNETLSSLEELGFLEVTHEDAQDVNTTHYTVTELGLSSLEELNDLLPQPVRQLINRYVNETRAIIKKAYESSANYFPIVETNEFKVKCGVYEDKRALLELFVSVDTREQAKLIQSNWRTSTSLMYEQIIDVLTTAKKEEE